MATNLEQPRTRAFASVFGGFGTTAHLPGRGVHRVGAARVGRMNGLKSKGQVVNRPFALPDPVLWSNYTEISCARMHFGSSYSTARW